MCCNLSYQTSCSTVALFTVVKVVVSAAVVLLVVFNFVEVTASLLVEVVTEGFGLIGVEVDVLEEVVVEVSLVILMLEDAVF